MSNTTLTLEEIIAKIPKVKTNRNYWFVRTQAGIYYKPYMLGGFIAIGFDKISLEEISQSRTEDKTGNEILKSKIKKKYPDEVQHGHAANQLLKFTYEIKKGDIVLIPSEGSSYISFGEVEETPVFNEYDNKFGCSFHKRKKVKWLKTISRDHLDPNLYRLMFTHHTISSANQYAEAIDNEISSFYIKGDKAHVVLNVRTKKNIKAKELFQMGLGNLELFDEFCEQENYNYNSDDFDLKIDVQSPGFIAISGYAIGGILVLGMIIMALCGGGFKFKHEKSGMEFDLHTDGFIEKLRKFLQSRQRSKTETELLKSQMKNLKIEDPKDLRKMLRDIYENEK